MRLMHSIFVFLRQVAREFQEDNAPLLGAAVAYYAVFAIAPVLVLALAVAGAIFGRDAAEGQLVENMQFYVGTGNAEFIQGLLANAKYTSSKGYAAVVGSVTLLIAAMGLFNNLQRALNVIWDVPYGSGKGWRAKLRKRVTSFIMVLVVGALLTAAVIASTILAALTRRFGNIVDANIPVMHWVEVSASLLFITLLFALIYRYLPDAEVRWPEAIIGATVTGILFGAGKFAIAFYLGRSSVNSVYGAAGSMAALLVWVYYSAQIFFVGAEFAQVWAHWKNPAHSITVEDVDEKPS